MSTYQYLPADWNPYQEWVRDDVEADRLSIALDYAEGDEDAVEYPPCWECGMHSSEGSQSGLCAGCHHHRYDEPDEPWGPTDPAWCDA